MQKVSCWLDTKVSLVTLKIMKQMQLPLQRVWQLYLVCDKLCDNRGHGSFGEVSSNITKFYYHRMTILSSREHSCVHPVVSRGKSKNEECKKLLDGSAVCRNYFVVQSVFTAVQCFFSIHVQVSC